MKELVTLLGGHPLALDIAASLIRYPRRLRSVLEGLKQGVAQRTLEQLKLPHGETRGTNLERSLALSYSKMSSEEQRRFRVLGVFSAEKPITVEAAAAVWGISDLSAAQNSLFELVDLALLDEMEDESGISYYQSKLLHLYAEALLDKAGELNAARWSHAEYYCGVVLRAEGAIPKDYPLLDRHIQNLLAALQWANVHEPTLFSRLVEASCRFLHSREQLDLLEFYLPKAINAATKPKRRAILLKNLGDLESRLGNVDEARAHYDAALPLYRAERDRLGEANIYLRAQRFPGGPLLSGRSRYC